ERAGACLRQHVGAPVFGSHSSGRSAGSPRNVGQSLIPRLTDGQAKRYPPREDTVLAFVSTKRLAVPIAARGNATRSWISSSFKLFKSRTLNRPATLVKSGPTEAPSLSKR